MKDRYTYNQQTRISTLHTTLQHVRIEATSLPNMLWDFKSTLIVLFNANILLEELLIGKK